MIRDVLIIGGGVIGCSIAYHLAKQGVKVTILEKDSVAAHASSAAAGMLGAQSEMDKPDPMVNGCLKSRAMFPALHKELLEVTGIDFELNQTGMLKVATNEQTAEQLRKRGRWQREIGQEAIWLNTQEVLKMEPHLTPHCHGALYLPHDYQVSAPKLSQALAQGAKHFGAEFIEQAEVIKVTWDKDQIVAVHTETATYYPDQIVIAAGIWSESVAELFQCHLPMVPLKGESLAILPKRPLLHHTVFADCGYLVPKANGEIVVGATEVPDVMDECVTAKGVHSLLERALSLLPELAEGELRRCWAGIRPESADQYPYLGKIAAYANLYVATGHRRNGILLAPITGKWMSELILKGSTEIDPAFCSNRVVTRREVS